MNNRITQLLKAIADPTRRDLFHALLIAATALPITQISNNFNISRQGITKHLKILEDAGLVTINKEGRKRFCKADAKPLSEIKTWLSFYENYWDSTLDSLGDYLDSKTT